MNTFNKVCTAFMAAVMLCLVQPHGATIIVRGPVVGGGGAAPSYDSRALAVAETIEGYHSGSSDTKLFPSTIAAGKRVVITMLYGESVTGMTLSSVSDTRGNTWTVHGNRAAVLGGSFCLAIASAHVSTQIENGDTVTLTWSSPGACYRFITIDVLANCASSGQPDVVFNGTDEDGSPAAFSASTTATNTVAFGLAVVLSSSFSATAWDSVATNSNQIWYKKEFTSSGSKDPSLTHAGTYTAGLWVAFK